MSIATAPILRADKVTVSFDGFKAVQELDFELLPNEVHFLIGPNGAGKTTLLDSMCGRVKPASGRVLFHERHNLTRLQEHQIARLGVGRKFQAPSVFLSLPARDNLTLAAKSKRSVWSNIFSKKNAETEARIDAILAQVNLTERQYIPAGELSHGEKQWLEIAMLLVQNPDAILLDEPAAGMTDAETDKMGEMLRQIAKSHAVMVVEHDMEFVRKYADRVTVMHEGRVLCAGTMDEVQANPKVAEVYLGRREERH